VHRILYLIIGLLLGCIAYGLGKDVFNKLKPDISRIEVAQAFQERDRLLDAMIKKIKELEANKDVGSSKNKAR